VVASPAAATTEWWGGPTDPVYEPGEGDENRTRRLVGRRPVGNIRKLPAGGYGLRFQRYGVFRTSPEVYGTRAEAEQALWKMADDGRADCHHDRRYLALVLWPRSPACAGAN
jgi:hypothetical protein